MTHHKQPIKSVSSYVNLLMSLVLFSTRVLSAKSPLLVHEITRDPTLRYENLAIRSNGQILTTTTAPNASVYQVDPLGVLPPTLIYTVPNDDNITLSAVGITEGQHDIFYFASGFTSLRFPPTSVPSSYSIHELDMRDVAVLPNGCLTRPPLTRRVANLTGASLLNGIALSRPEGFNLLVADSFRGLIWNVDLRDGDVTVTLNDTMTKGVINATDGRYTGINGLKVQDRIMHWTVTGTSKMYRAPIDERGYLVDTPTLVASNITCDDLIIDAHGVAYVAGPLNVITKVSPSGKQEIIAGTYNSSTSDLGGPSALRFGRLASDRWSLYVTTNGGLQAPVPGNSRGVFRIDL